MGQKLAFLSPFQVNTLSGSDDPSRKGYTLIITHFILAFITCLRVVFPSPIGVLGLTGPMRWPQARVFGMIYAPYRENLNLHLQDEGEMYSAANAHFCHQKVFYYHENGFLKL